MSKFDITKVDPSQIEEVPVITTDIVYTKRVDFVPTASGQPEVLYKGEAGPGSLGSTASWRIVRITINTEGDVLEEWADGNANFDNIWDNRASLTYS